MISKSHFVGEHIDDITKNYNIIKEIGHGTYGKVLRIQNKSTGTICACKKMSKRRIKNLNLFKTEIDLLRAMDHPNIIKLYSIYEDINYLYLIMEECLGGEFFDRLAKRSRELNMYTERDAAKIFRQILEAVNYLHFHGVCHRDIKPENILFSTIEENSPIKLIDFGLSKIFNADDSKMKGVVGTTFYMAPEVITGEYNQLCDVWSCGVILYIMLCGKPPFYSSNEKELKKKICAMKYDFNYPEFKKVSNEGKELISSILVPSNQRPNIADILQMKWVKEFAANGTNEALNINWNHIQRYTKLNLVQKSVINFTAFHLSEEETRKFVDMFKSIDENSDGVLSIEEIKNGMDKCNFGTSLSRKEIVDMFNEMDVDKNGLINYNEFISALMDYKKFIKKEHLIECFKSYDTDGSGKISFEEFCDMIKPQSEKERDSLFILYKTFDKDGDGEINFKEFVEGFNKMD